MKNRKLVKLLSMLLAASLCSVTSSAQPSGDGSEALEREAVDLLSRYIQIDTTNPPGNEIQAAQFFKTLFDKEGIETRIFESAPGRGNIYARLKGDGSKKAIVLLNHMDVVPADKRYWTAEPFGGAIKDGYIWGRGAIDMKGMAILETMAMLGLKRHGVPLKGDVIFMGVADEEAGGAMGAGFMVRDHFDLLKDAGVVVNELAVISVGDDGKVRYWGIDNAEKSPFWLKLTATGTPGHGSMPRPDSAANKLVRALDRVVNYQTPLKVVPGIEQFYAETAYLEPSPRRERLKDLRTSLKDPAFASEFTKDLQANALVRDTISLTSLEGSNKTNVISPQASAELDIRLLPGEDPNAFLSELRKVIGDESIKIEPILSFNAGSSPTDSDFFRVVTAVAKERDPGAPVVPILVTGFTDCHFFRDKGIPCYGFTPIKLSDKEMSRIHGNDERISVDNMKLGTQIMYEVVRKLATE